MHTRCWTIPSALHLLVHSTFLLVPIVVGQRDWWEKKCPDIAHGEPYVNDLRVYLEYGDVKGFSVPWHIFDESWDMELDAVPWYCRRRVNVFLGIPYAAAPLGPLRFRRSTPPRWKGIWDATFFRPACPQNIDYVRQELPGFTHANVSEDCLYMNIFAPNMTYMDHSDETKYPVIVLFQGGDHLYGTSQQYPGHVLATQMVVVVTFNYRLGALGYMTTEDLHSMGNFGMHDQLLALRFVKENIAQFKGDPSQITVMGDGTGAGDVGMQLVSPVSARYKDLFHQCIMMSGSELSRNSFVHPFWQPRRYAEELAKILKCPMNDHYAMVECLRQPSVTWENIVLAQHQVKPFDGDLGKIWGPTQDYYFNGVRIESMLPYTPEDLRQTTSPRVVPCIIGMTPQDGAELANETIIGLGGGMSKNTFRQFVDRMLRDWRVQDIYRERIYETIEFQYTHWSDPTNATARSQEYIEMITDLNVGAGVDLTAKMMARKTDVFFYEFSYRSWNEVKPKWMGVSSRAAMPYVLGVPFMNETVLNETNFEARHYYDYDDRNMSDFMMLMWSNFAKYGEPTLNLTRNITWEIFNDYNLTYLIIAEESHLWFQYRQNKYGFWSEYYPRIAKMRHLFSTPMPTALGREYEYATWSMLTVLVVMLIIVLICILLLVQQSRHHRAAEHREFAASALALATSHSTVSRVMTPPPQSHASSVGMPWSSPYRDQPSYGSSILEKSGGMRDDELASQSGSEYRHNYPAYGSHAVKPRPPMAASRQFNEFSTDAGSDRSRILLEASDIDDDHTVYEEPWQSINATGGQVPTRPVPREFNERHPTSALYRRHRMGDEVDREYDEYERERYEREHSRPRRYEGRYDGGYDERDYDNRGHDQSRRSCSRERLELGRGREDQSLYAECSDSEREERTYQSHPLQLDEPYYCHKDSMA